MAAVEKYKRGDRVTINPEAVEGLEHLFPDGFSTFEGTVTSSRFTFSYDPYPKMANEHYVYNVALDQDRSVHNLQFVEADMSLLLPADIAALDVVIGRSESNLNALKLIRNQMADAYRDKG
jgi:hypothetical protein